MGLLSEDYEVMLASLTGHEVLEELNRVRPLQPLQPGDAYEYFEQQYQQCCNGKGLVGFISTVVMADFEFCLFQLVNVVVHFAE